MITGGDSGLEIGAPIKTSRLILKPQSLNDFDRFYTMSKDPDVMAFIGDGSVFHWTREVALAKFKHRVSASVDDGLGTRSIYRKQDALYLGWCAIAPSVFLNHMELGYRMCRDVWGNGYTTEAAAAMLAAAYGRMDIDRIKACAHPDNVASIRVLEKLGFKRCGSKLSKPIGREIPVYQIDRRTHASVSG